MELAGAGTGAGALDVADNLGRRGSPPASFEGRCWRRDADLLVWFGKEGVDRGGLGGSGGEGAFLGRALGSRVGGGGDGFWAFGRHGG